ncbi:MAG: hypothetical protein ACKO96_15445, partial [Flammeovirgaceae bacterium]
LDKLGFVLMSSFPNELNSATSAELCLRKAGFFIKEIGWNVFSLMDSFNYSASYLSLALANAG